MPPKFDRKEYMKEYQRKWMAKRRAEYMADKECVWCGYRKDLHMHHVDPSKKVSHRFWSWSKERRDLEISKCIILCKECHQYLHKITSQRWVHGVANTYP